MNLQEKYLLIRNSLRNQTSPDPVKLVNLVMNENFVSMHGAEHHFLDGAAFLTAYRNAGGEVNLERAWDMLAERTIQMPGAMCGYWGVCGSVTSVGAALSILRSTGPLSTDESYQENMRFTSHVIAQMSMLGGARCCKRNAYLSLQNGAKFVKETYGIGMKADRIHCSFFPKNTQCIAERCPFYQNKQGDRA